MDFTELVERAHAMNVYVIASAIDADGVYCDAAGLIVLNPRLTRSGEVFTLAHELVHALRCDVCAQSREVEVLVDQAAARMLVDPVAYAAAERLVGGDVYGLAEELGVSVECVVAYRGWLANHPDNVS